jgi:hypothetical protein
MYSSTVLTVATVVTPLMGSFQSIFGFEFLVLDGRTDRSSFTNGGPRNGGMSRTSEILIGDGDNGGNGCFVFGCKSGEGANEGRGGDGGKGGSGDNGGNSGSGMADNGGDGVKGGDAYGRSSSAHVRRCRIQTL